MATATVPTVSAIIILDNEGHRIAAKYFVRELKDFKAQTAFEKKVFSKTNKTGRADMGDILTLDKLSVVYKSLAGSFFCVVVPSHENELVALSVLNALEETVSNALRGMLSKRALVDNLDVLLLAIDEICDDGLILETDPSQLCNRVSSFNLDRDASAEQTLARAWEQAKDQIARSLR